MRNNLPHEITVEKTREGTCDAPRTMKAQSGAQACERISLLLFNLSYRDSKRAGNFLTSYEKCLLTSLMKETWVSSDFQNGYVCACQVVLVCLILCDPMDCSRPGSSVHGILQARILEWVAVPPSSK